MIQVYALKSEVERNHKGCPQYLQDLCNDLRNLGGSSYYLEQIKYDVAVGWFKRETRKKYGMIADLGDQLQQINFKSGEWVDEEVIWTWLMGALNELDR